MTVTDSTQSTENQAIQHWKRCMETLKTTVSPKQFKIWLSPLQAHYKEQEQTLWLLAPNTFVYNYVKDTFFEQIQQTIAALDPALKLNLWYGSNEDLQHRNQTAPPSSQGSPRTREPSAMRSHLNPRLDFAHFVQGKSNQMGLAAAQHVASAPPGQGYNPLFIYGGVGLGKSHLMHAIGNQIKAQNPESKILYLNSEKFVGDMIKALQHNTMNDFKRFYRSINTLLIDDIQFFAGKERSQEEFFHTFNALIDNHQQIVITSDRYPKDINGLEERLTSRFGWGLTVAIEPPELETRVAILMAKAEQSKIQLPNEVAFFVAKHIQSNVRELEGALKRIIANAHFTGKAITLDFARDALKDLLALQAKLVTIDNIQKTVAEYYKVKMSDLLSKRRNRSIARPRQMAMALAKELTSHSLPEIGNAFSGRDHTTVLHACKKIKELRDTTVDIQEDWKNLSRILTA